MKKRVASALVMACVAYSSPASATCTLDGSFIDGTCRYVQVGVNSNGTTDDKILYDSVDSATAALTFGAPPEYGYFDGFARADLASGTLKAYVDTIGGGGANAAWLESVKFDLPDGVDSITIPITVRLEGINTHRPYASYNNIGLIFQAASYLLPGADGNHFDVSQVVKYCGFDTDFTTAICQDGPVFIEYTDTLTIWEDVFYAFQFAVLVGGTNITQDFGHTARFSWELPDDVSFVSSSGTFMTAVTAPVPEPATWAMMLMGFGLVGGAMRKRPTGRLAKPVPHPAH